MVKIKFLILFCGIFACSEAKELGVKIERSVPVPMRDGTILRADVYRPDRDGPYPVLVQRTPYGKSGYFEPFVKAGYIVVSQDVRGRYESGGEYELMRVKKYSGIDGYDTVEWAAKLPGSTGKVGTFGRSALASAQWLLAPLRPPSLVAMSAQSTLSRRHDGETTASMRPYVFLQAFATTYTPDMRRRKNRPGVHTSWEAQKLWIGGEAQKWLIWLPWLDLPQEIFEDYTDSVKYWFNNPQFVPTNLYGNIKNISVPNIDVTGWYDFCNDELLFRTMVKEAKTELARKGSRIIIGPWNHVTPGRRNVGDFDFGPNAVLNNGAVQIRWFDYWLKGKQNGVDKDPPVKIFVMGDNQWRDEQHWPPQRIEEKVLYIASGGHANTPRGDGKFVRQKPGQSMRDEYVYNPNDPVLTLSDLSQPLLPIDQRPLADRQDILVYKTEPLTERIEVTGNPVVELYAESSVPDTDWFVRLIDVAPDGVAVNVSDGVVRAKYREGFDRPNLLKSGEVSKYTICMRATSNAFLPGHRIRLDISSSDFPNYDRNHNTAANQYADATLAIANQTVYSGAEHATRIILPWIPNQIEEGPAEKEKPEPKPEKQMHLLHQAAADGNIKQLKLLISKEVDINAKDERGMAPLDYAAEAGRKEVAQLLIQEGADVNAGPWTALHIVAGKGLRDMAELLIRNGADINAKSAGNITPLHMASMANRIEMIELLITEGADINAIDYNDITPLGRAILANNENVVKLFIAKLAGLDFKDGNGLTLLHNAAVSGNQDLVELLLSKGAKVDERDDNYEFTALHYAARFGSKNVAEVLIANGADIKAKDKWDYQPIHWAAYHDRPDIVELLIAKGADVNAKTSLGQTPLELAIPRRNTAAIEVLRKHRAKE